MPKIDPYPYDQNHRYSDVRHARRKLFNRILQIFWVLGILCLLGAAFFAAMSAIKNLPLVRYALLYLVAGFSFIFLGTGLQYLRTGKAPPKKYRSSGGRRSSKNTYSRRACSRALRYEVLSHRRSPFPSGNLFGGNSRSGAALVLVMGLVVLLSALLLQSQWLARSASQQQEQQENWMRLKSSATLAAYQALQALADDEDREVDHLDEGWAEPMDLNWADGIAHRVEVVDLNRFFDLNNLRVDAPGDAFRTPLDITMDLMTLHGDFTPLEKAEAIRDWVDEDTDGPAEAWLYRELNRDPEPANEILSGWSELLQVYRMDRSLWVEGASSGLGRNERPNLLDLFSVVPVQRDQPLAVNVNTASENTLVGILGFREEEAARAIIVMRSQDSVLNRQDLGDLLSARPERQAARGYLSLSSTHFSVEVQSYLQGQSLRLRCLAQRHDDGRVQVLRWVFG